MDNTEMLEAIATAANRMYEAITAVRAYAASAKEHETLLGMDVWADITAIIGENQE
jgi:hypothetical protein